MSRLFAWLRGWLARPSDFEGELRRALSRTRAIPVDAYPAPDPGAPTTHRNSH